MEVFIDNSPMDWIKQRVLSTLLTLSLIYFSGEPILSKATRLPIQNGGDLIAYRSIHHPIIGRRGMVAAQNKIAARIGANILRQGGNAIDAAVAVGFAQAVTLPRAGNLGGGGFMMIYLAKTKQTVALDYYNRLPNQCIQHPNLYQKPPSVGYPSVAVPGTVAGLWAAHQKYGTLPWKKLVEPAITLAQQGVTLSDDESHAFNQFKRSFLKDPETSKVFFKSNHTVYRPGEPFKQPDLAHSLALIRDQGAFVFYKGLLGQQIVNAVQGQGGCLSLNDLAHYQVIFSQPLWSTYRGYRIALMPPPAGGLHLGEIMNILETFPLSTLKSNSVASIHLIAEALKLGFRNTFFSDKRPQCSNTTYDSLNKKYAAKLAQLISPDQTVEKHLLTPPSSVELKESSDTTHYSIVDSQGNAVSNTYTLGSSFGARVIPPKTGILLNNSLRLLITATYQRPEPIPNLSPSETRILSKICPIIVFKEKQPWLVTGTPGGNYITSIMTQFLVNAIDHGFNVAEATMRPRFHQGRPKTDLAFEDAMPYDCIRLLEKKGHHIKPSATMGSLQSIMIEGSTLYGASDTRRPDAATISV